MCLYFIQIYWLYTHKYTQYARIYSNNICVYDHSNNIRVYVDNIRVYSIEILICVLVCLVDLTNENCGFKLAGLRQIWLPTIMETETEIDFSKELKRPLMTVFGLEQLTLYRKTSLIIYVKGNKQVAYQAKLFIF